MTLRLEHDGAVAIVTLDRPDRRNAFTMAMRGEIATLFDNLAQDDGVRAVVLTGAGGYFCSGADTGEMGAADSAAFLKRMRALHRMIRAIMATPKPVIAAVDGVCVGAGWSLALACDLTLASPNASFAQLFGRIGYAPDAGAIWQLTRLVGPMRAKEIVYSGRTLTADEALHLGLILSIEADRPIRDAAIDLATRLAKGPPVAQAMNKQLFEATTLSFDQFLDREFMVQPLLATTADHREGLAATRDKRAPNFIGR